MRISVYKQLFLRMTEKDVFSRVYDNLKIVYIHIPKVAGTSISDALYNVDPGHFSSAELSYINKIKYQKFYKFTFVRHPVTRFISTYKYAVKVTSLRPNSPLAFMTRYDDVNDFIINGLTKKIIDDHYFLWTQSKYSGDISSLDFIGKFENLQNDFESLCSSLQLQVKLPYLNKSEPAQPTELNNKGLLRLHDLYSVDFDNFKYSI